MLFFRCGWSSLRAVLLQPAADHHIREEIAVHMVEYFVTRNIHHSDLFLIHYGTEQCRPGHAYGPAVRDHFLLHFITAGKGIYQVGDRTYPLREGQGFMIFPNEVTYYQADNETPWTYYWVGFNGILAETLLQRAGITPETPTFDCGADRSIQHCVTAMINLEPAAKARDIRLTAHLYEFMSALIESNPLVAAAEKQVPHAEYAEKVVRFIEMNYANKITVAEIASSIGLNRSYLNAIFHKQMNTSIQDYLIRYRMQRACQLMRNDALSIGDIARSVGYDDPLHFSKMFKKYQGQSPSEYRQRPR